MASPVITEKASVELKSTSRNQQKGLWAEAVAMRYFINQGYQLLHQRKKLKYGEVDLIFQKNGNILFIEVKFLHNIWMAFERLSSQQKNRIIKNQIYYQQQNLKYKVIGQLCLVDKLQKVTLIDLS